MIHKLVFGEENHVVVLMTSGTQIDIVLYKKATVEE